MDINIDKDRVMTFLGYGEKKCPAVIEKKIDSQILRAKELIMPQCFYAVADIGSHEDKTALKIGSETYEFEGSYVREGLSKSNKAVALVYSVGPFVDEEINLNTQSFKTMEALVLDKASIVALDEYKRLILDDLRANLYPLLPTKELYPARGDFEVKAQGEIYRASMSCHKVIEAPGYKIGINQYNQLSPIKSVAMIIGFGKSESTENMCDECDQRDKCGGCTKE